MCVGLGLNARAREYCDVSCGAVIINCHLGSTGDDGSSAGGQKQKDCHVVLLRTRRRQGEAN